ncbi:MAG: lipoyl(octanoyl) transferase LipB [Dehalococcoidia bacterium]|jgi:lipoate-protein ligase B|nr:lipoyl(octanoyl) transferase LipB [Dehalococcoidia bacterium]
MAATVQLLRAGRLEYRAALRWQRETATLVRNRGPGGSGSRDGRDHEAVMLVEHCPVYTLGRRGGGEHVLRTEAELAARGAELIKSDRGGDVTFHGPGQLVVYPILDLRARGIGSVDYVRALERVVIDTLHQFGLTGARVRGRPGVWTGNAKLAAIGVRVQGGVSTHGLALNVSTDLSWFDAIVPCGLPDAGIASLQGLLGTTPPIAEVESAVVRGLRARLGLDLREVHATAVEQGLRRAG